ncbi:MAG: UDP-N-acetylmuramoyl-tripeptide--D-alanyl-D-alanine ligase [Planctomycetota bacterium]|jgi:UDP-N-acetylmuramoyl-tripeptide--D-alanyl-D-alanine ligase
MKEFAITTLARIIKAKPTKNISGFFTGVNTDSRTTQTGDCFFAIPGDNFDGHDYIADAFARGVACAVVSREIKDTKFIDKLILKVNDTVRALGDFAAEYRRRMGFKVVAITGSVGKTTTRQIAYHVLSRNYRVFQSPKNFNNNIGLPLTLLAADPDDQIVIAELGSNHPGEIAYLTRIAQPNIAVVTNVCPAHLAGFGDLQTIMQEKLSISEGLQPGGILIINADLVKCLNGNQLNHQSPVTNHQIITFGKSDGSDWDPKRNKRRLGTHYQARNIDFTGSGSSFTIDGLSPCGDSTRVYLPLLGPGNVENALAAWAICSQFGLTIDDFAQAVKGLLPVSMRAELLKIGTLTVLNDCYNANPASMKNALAILTGLPFCNKSQSGVPAKLDSGQQPRFVFICGDMAELGQQAQALHAELGASVAQAGVHLLLAVGKFAKITAGAAKRTAEYGLQTKCFEETLSACNNLEKCVKDYDIILVKGSRVAGMEMAVEKLKELFS